MTLHVINKTPQNRSLYLNMLNGLSSGDAVLLIEDAVYSALEAHQSIFTALSPDDIQLSALEADIQARGLEDKLSPRFSSVNDQGFVKLSCEHDKIVSWY